MMTIDEIMTSEPITLGAGATLDQAGKLMLEHRIRHIPIVDENAKLLGLVTQRDLLVAGIHDSEKQVGEVMREQLYTVDVQSDLRSAGLLMQKHKIGSLPVMDADKLAGIVTDTDYVSLAINLLEQFEENDPSAYDDDVDDFEN